MAEPQPTATGVLEMLRPEVLPRVLWAGDLDPVGPLATEDDVRFILVHHTASHNDYSRDETTEQIRKFYRLHIGPGRGWPDVAYNFLVDRFGRIWEGRAGSLERAVRGDATGGSQGYAQLCALIGDHRTEPVTAEAATSLINLVAWLGQRHGIDTTPSHRVAFVSRGSTRWPAGTKVVTSTIAGHRDMSLTSCPGDAAYDLITERLPAAVTRLREQTARLVVADPDTVAAEAARGEEATDHRDAGHRGVGDGGTSGSRLNRTGPESRFIGDSADNREAAESPDQTPVVVGLGVGGSTALAALGAIVALRRRRSM